MQRSKAENNAGLYVLTVRNGQAAVDAIIALLSCLRNML